MKKRYLCKTIRRKGGNIKKSIANKDMRKGKENGCQKLPINHKKWKLQKKKIKKQKNEKFYFIIFFN